MCSLSLSSALVASSSSSTSGSRKMARAMAIRCFWPPDTCAPRSPTSVSKPCGKLEMKSKALALFAAASTSARLAPGLPIAMFSAIVPENSTGS
ncbi:hypothetical protein PF002_g15626 [Phytophthora fragariae]|uniref:Uncharacterized protein n=1 Tax=Phytophthora fragariae TaxID=53985 RepID=A0A6A3YPT4_9STRA|nr:hypothetical protein PF002_g15626 [Phytophthora fragariae]